MPFRAPSIALAGALSALPLVLAAAPARASALAFGPCHGAAGFSCASLQVPLERSGGVSGSISLSVERKLAGPAPAASAVVALAGGPGQAAIPLAEFMSQAIAPALHSRDLLVFDQRGTGTSDALHCAAFESFSTASGGNLFERCAEQIGPARDAFTTQESVQDIEALREATGYSKLVLYGTSYGTKVALEYAERFPQYVEALVLDSVVSSAGPEPLGVPTFEAIPGALRELCLLGACGGITREPVADVARLAARLRTRAASGSVYDGNGVRHNSSISELGLLQTIEAGDLNPALRALLPAAVQSALRGDPDPLLRLHLLSEGLIPTVPRENVPPQAAEQVDEALFATTTCEESPFPWQRSAPAAVRLQEATAALRALPSSDFYPFEDATAFENSLLSECASWPASSPPPATGALPDVPALLLSGAQDVRTPAAVAREVAAGIPDAQLEVVPYTGHSVLGSDLSGCAEHAVAEFFAGRPVQPCSPGPDPFAPTPITPTRLSQVSPPAGLPGRPGQTLVAVLDTIVDLERQIVGATLQAGQQLPNGASFGGLHGGYARLSASAAVLHDFVFVPGVSLSATLPVRAGQLQSATIRVSGSSAAHGTVTLTVGSSKVRGTLGGKRFDLLLSRVRISQAGAGAQWPTGRRLSALLGRRP